MIPVPHFYLRRFVAMAVCVLFIATIAPATRVQGAPQPPNILYIVTDQQHAGMMSCAGNEYVKTPAMDSLAATGVRFERAYCTNPVCLPSRVSMMTGHYPSYFGIRANGDGRRPIPENALPQCLGWVFRNAGYETAFGGKRHWPKNMNPESLGFTNITKDERDGLAQACAAFLEKSHDKPFLLVASFINPHDICYMAIDAHARAEQREGLYPQSRVERERLAIALQPPDGVSQSDFFKLHCPPLPANHEVPPREPTLVTEHLGNGFKRYVRDHWTDRDWRLHRWAYCRLTEMVDAQIGRVLAALAETGLERKTLVVFSSDHGDMDSSHRLEHKTVFYEEAARVPFIVSFPGVTPPGSVNRTHLVSAGNDLFPTLCDYAGVDEPAGLPGRSVRSLAEGRQPSDWRDQLVVESRLGHMLRTARYKYNAYESGEHREQLIDLQTDPGEMVNLAEDPQYAEILNDHRTRLHRWVEQTAASAASP